MLFLRPETLSIREETREAFEEQEAVEPALLLFLFFGTTSQPASELAREGWPDFDFASKCCPTFASTLAAGLRSRDQVDAEAWSTSGPTAESVSPHLPRTAAGWPSGSASFCWTVMLNTRG